MDKRKETLKETFNMDVQNHLYLKRMGLTEAQMHPAERRERKRTFMAAAGQIMVLLRDDLTELDEAEAIETAQKMLDQVQDFFVKEAGIQPPNGHF